MVSARPSQGWRTWPGLWLLQRGNPRILGCLVVSVIVICVVTLVFRFDRLSKLMAGGAWDWSGLLVIFGAPVLVLWLGRRKPPRPRAGKSQWVLVRERFMHSPLAQIGLWFVVLLYLIMFLTPFLTPYTFDLQVDAGRLKLMAPMQEGFLFGSDQLSRDILSRVLYGARISLTIGFVAVGLSVSLGMAVGLLSGFLGGWVDMVLMRVVDVLLSIPRLVLLLVFMVLFATALPSEWRVHLMVAILGATGWMGTSRIVRGEVLSLKSRDFIQAGRALGFSNLRLMLRHVAPNCLAPVIVAATLGIGATILVEASLSFLGLGVPDPYPSWGKMVAEGKEYLTKAWWMTTIPGFTIVFAVLSFNLLGDGLRDALDPRTVLRSSLSTDADDEDTDAGAA